MTSSQTGAQNAAQDAEKGRSSGGQGPRSQHEAAAIVGEILSDEVLPAGAYWHKRLAKGVVLRIVDLEGCQAVDTLIYDASDTAVRYNAANTMKLGHSIYLSKGSVIYDDLARPMMRIIEDTCGRHDTLAGNCSREINMVRYGKSASKSCRDNFLAALEELGMGPRDLPANINFFMNVPVDADGRLAIVDGISKPGDWVDLRCERDLIVVISNCPQEHNPCSGGRPTPIRLTTWRPR
jgi:urea carboxylase-associated protein 1